MKKTMVFFLSIALFITITGCNNNNHKNSSEIQTDSNSMDETNMSIDINSFNIVGYDYEPGDFKYQFELTDEQQIELKDFLQPENWKYATHEELPEYGLTCVLAAKNEEAFLYVSQWNENTTIIKISPINGKSDGSDSNFYFAPFEVGEDSKSFMENFKTLN